MIRRSVRRVLLQGSVAVAAAFSFPATAPALTLEPIGSYAVPTYATSDPADPDRTYVVERPGLIKVTEGGFTRVFADLRSRVSCCIQERGLHSMAFPPDFPESGRFFVQYTRSEDPSTPAVEEGNVRIDELRASAATAVGAEPRVLLEIPHPRSDHNGGQLQWGPDGYLYSSVGDGGGVGDTDNNSQSTSSLLGKILRIDPSPVGAATPYTTPASNPFAGGPGADEVYSYGLRNPWRFSFDRLTGDMLIADVGQFRREEVNFSPTVTGRGLGANFGWSCREGLSPYSEFDPPDPACAGAGGFTDPVLDYPHGPDPGGDQAYGCSITGGYVVRDPTLRSLYGRYLYIDYCTAALRSLTPVLGPATDDRGEGVTAISPQSFGEDACGRIYLTQGSGGVYRLADGEPAPCPTLGVAIEGDGAGTVAGRGVACPGDCHESLPLGGPIELTAAPAAGSVFSGWGGACVGEPGTTCSVALGTDQALSARFTSLQPIKGSPPPALFLAAPKTRVDRGSRARLVARASATGCGGDRVALRRDGRKFGSKRLGQDCRAAFSPRIRRAHRFRAFLLETGAHGEVASRRVRVRVTALPS